MTEEQKGRSGEEQERPGETAEDRPRRTGTGVRRPGTDEPHARGAATRREVGSRPAGAGAGRAAPVPAADVALEDRPGTPREAEPEADPGAHWATPERQPVGRPHLRREGLRELTPVFGTAQPPRGLSGSMRGAAYRIPEHRARHWALLMAADRVDVLEGRIGRYLAKPLRATGFSEMAGAVERQPLVALVGVLAAGWLAGRAVR